MTSRLPFSVRVLEAQQPVVAGVEEAKRYVVAEVQADTNHDADDNFKALLPATFRTKEDHITIPSATSEFLQTQLSVKKLNDIHDWLWICGRPMPPRPLHHQEVLSRELTTTENIELHLVWTSRNRLFLKPIPPYLLSPDFWEAHLLPKPDLDTATLKQRADQAACALGFLHSYTALIAYESDYRIAYAKGLIPSVVTWESWKLFAAELLGNHCYAAVSRRFWYGELRLSRLNKVYRFKLGYWFRGYSKVAAHTLYIDLLRDNFATLAGILGYVVIVLTALQVGLGTEYLAGDSRFQGVSWVFTLVSILLPLVAGVVIVVIVLAMFVGNWVATKGYERSRFREMGVERVVKEQEKRVNDGSERLMGKP